MAIGTGLLIMFAVILAFININLRSKIKDMKKTEDRQKNDLAMYINAIIGYREILIRNNIDISNTTLTVNDPKNKYTIDSILDEIAEKGMENISEDKLNFLKSKRNGKKD